MRLIQLLLIGAIAACAPPQPPIQPAAGPLPPADLSFDLLSAHNRERRSAGVPPLLWDHRLAYAAAAYGRQVAAHGALRHSPPEARRGQGENLWMGTRGAFMPAQMVASWSSERALFRPGLFPAISRTGNWASVGHYSQMIWPTTTHLGCAIVSGARSDVLVCRYVPAGNIDGQRVP
jgi:hypothetical protein